MKKVLIISYRFHEKENIGAVRIRGLAKFLPDFGWTPIILTVKYPSIQDGPYTIIETEEGSFWKRIAEIFRFSEKRNLQKPHETFKNHKNSKVNIFLFKIWEEIFTYPTATYSSWERKTVKNAFQLLDHESIDAIISSSGPTSTHLIARCIKRRLDIPWVADFRDPWTQNHNYHYSLIRKKIERKLEINTIADADHIVSVTEDFCKKLTRLHKNKEISLIYNGYDPDDLHITEKLSDKFSITYTGKIYSGFQDPEPLFKALHELIILGLLDEQDLEVNFYGGINEDAFCKVQTYDLQKSVKFHGKVTRQHALESQRKSQVLLLLSWNDPNEKGVIPAKIYEYLAAKRPILSIGKVCGGEVSLMLERTKAGLDFSDVENIKHTLLREYTEFKNQGSVQYQGIEEEIEKFSQREMARKYSDILNHISRK